MIHAFVSKINLRLLKLMIFLTSELQILKDCFRDRGRKIKLFARIVKTSTSDLLVVLFFQSGVNPTIDPNEGSTKTSVGLLRNKGKDNSGGSSDSSSDDEKKSKKNETSKANKKESTEVVHTVKPSGICFICEQVKTWRFWRSLKAVTKIYARILKYMLTHGFSLP